MGKGSGGCVTRAALSFADDASAEIPGRSGRAQETFKLIQEAGNFPPAYLLRDIRKPNTTIAPEAVDAPDIAHNALMSWVPSSYHGHGGYIPAHEQLRQEIMYAIMLDGDRQSNHLYFYRDKDMDAIWTLGSAAAARGWYRLPHDGDGNLVPQGLGQTVQASMYHSGGSFLTALRKAPLQTLAASIDVNEPGVALEELAPRLKDASAACQQTVWQALTREQSVPDAPLRHFKVRMALDLAEAEGCTDEERDILVQAAALAPAWGISTREAASKAPSPAVAALLKEIEPTQSEDNYTMLNPQTRLGCMLADAQQSWMSSPWCDWGIRQWQEHNGLSDSVETLEEMRNIIPRTPWWTKTGKGESARIAKTQESRIRALAGLTRGGTKLPPAPKGWKRLKARS